MEIVKNFINKFADILIPCHQYMVIGGIYALKLHGLETRDTADLDMVVYDPPVTLIKSLQDDQLQERGDYDSDIGDSRRKSFKLTRDALTIDFLMEYDEMKPNNLLTLLHSDRLWPVQSIKVVIDAKRKYGRDKDEHDLVQFAIDNFYWK